MEKIVPIESGVLGNTKTKTQVNKAKKWVFTFNNYTIDDLTEIVPKFNSVCSKWIFQEEKGEEGTIHLQGAIWANEKIRPTELKLSKKIHWELMKGTDEEVIKYCSKDDTRNGKIYKSSNCIIPKPLKIISKLRDWQVSLEKILCEEPDDRKIIWVYETEGNVGKSAFSRYMIHKYDALYLTEGKKTDIINIVYNRVIVNDVNTIILDVPRSNGNKISYKSLEEIKNGIICNTKYETGSKLINPPHIVVFSNESPDIDQFSKDRWEIYTIENNKLVDAEL